MYRVYVATLYAVMFSDCMPVPCIIDISVKKLNSLKHLVRTTVAGSHN